MLAVKIKGKSDTNWTNLYLYRNDEVPKLCPVRHLLVYVNLIGWKGRYLFPSLKKLFDPPDDGVFKSQIAGDDLYMWVHFLWSDLLNKKKSGFHTFCKTGYLWAYIGEAYVGCVMKAARHKSFLNAEKYLLGASALGLHIRHCGNSRNMCGTWLDPLCCQLDIHIDTSVAAGIQALSLEACARMFVQQVLKVESG